MRPALRAFAECVSEKIAIGPLTLGRGLAQLGRQGAAVGGATRMLGQQAAKGLQSVPGARQMLGHATEAVGAQKAVQATQGLKTPFLGRMQQAEALGARQFDTTKVLRHADTVGEHPYSAQALNTLAHRPQVQMTALAKSQAAPAVAPLGATQVTRRTPRSVGTAPTLPAPMV